MTDLPESATSQVRLTPGKTPVGRAWNRFVTHPDSVRRAIAVIVTANLTVVIVGGLLLAFVDPVDYPDVWRAFWYVLQTITTVGYGDVTPVEPIGRIIGALIMVATIASLSILTAFITSVFVEARQAARRAGSEAAEKAHRERVEDRLTELVERLERIEQQGTRRS